MFRAVFEDAKLFKAVFKTIANYLSEGCVDLTGEGIKLVGVDDSRITLLDVVMPSDIFYDFTVDEDIHLCLDFRVLRRILEKSKSIDNIELLYRDEKFFIELFRGTPEEKQNRRVFTLSRTEIEEPNISIKDVSDFDARVEIQAGYLADIINMASINRDTQVLMLESNHENSKLVFKSEGYIGIFEAPLDLDKDETVTRYEIRKNARAKYNINYIKKIMPALKTADFAEIAFGEQYPLMIRLELAKGLVIKSLIAPMIEMEG